MSKIIHEITQSITKFICKMQMGTHVGAASQLSEGFLRTWMAINCTLTSPRFDTWSGLFASFPLNENFGFACALSISQENLEYYPFWELQMPAVLICQGQVPLDSQAAQAGLTQGKVLVCCPQVRLVRSTQSSLQVWGPQQVWPMDLKTVEAYVAQVGYD